MTCARCGGTPTQALSYCEWCGYTPGLPVVAWLAVFFLAPFTAMLGVASVCFMLFSLEGGLPVMVLSLLPILLTVLLYRTCRGLVRHCTRYPTNRDQKQILACYVGFMLALSTVTFSDFRFAPDVLVSLALKTPGTPSSFMLQPDFAGWAVYALAATVLAIQLSKQAGRRRG
ncbi:MAG: hypothetical protein ACYCW6_20880 [Candidatus Xenobia bacterium]